MAFLKVFKSICASKEHSVCSFIKVLVFKKRSNREWF